jgi:hypothetical protein
VDGHQDVAALEERIVAPGAVEAAGHLGRQGRREAAGGRRPGSPRPVPGVPRSDANPTATRTPPIPTATRSPP